MRSIHSCILLAVLFLATFAVACAQAPGDAPVKVGNSGPDTPAPAPRTYLLTGGSKLTFVGYKKSGNGESGWFDNFTAKVEMTDGDPETATLWVTVNAGSIKTPNGMLTGHLRSKDFFDVGKFPIAKFVSDRIEETAEGYRISGDLTLLGVTLPFGFDATITVEGDTVRCVADFTLRQFDFGMTYTGRPNDPVVNGVAVHVDAKAKLAD